MSLLVPALLRRSVGIYSFTQTPRQIFDARFDLITNRTINGEIKSVRVANVPILERRRGFAEDRRAASRPSY